MTNSIDITFIYSSVIDKQTSTHYIIYDFGLFCSDGVITMSDNNEFIIPFHEYFLFNIIDNNTYIKLINSLNNKILKQKEKATKWYRLIQIIFGVKLSCLSFEIKKK